VKRLLLIRHCTTLQNAEGRMVSTDDPPLSDFGSAEAKALGESLANVSIERIITSPMLRCRQTAEAIATAQSCEVAVQVDERLRELRFGVMEGLGPEEIRIRGLGEVFRAWRQGRPPLYPEGAETFDEAADRAKALYDEVISLTEECIALVGHSHALRILVAVSVLGVDPEAHRRFRLDHGVASEIRWELGTPRLVALNAQSLQPR
jgi:ribonuclease H / adenosylcobalamin/alpha-ribazole phosphatase